MALHGDGAGHGRGRRQAMRCPALKNIHPLQAMPDTFPIPAESLPSSKPKESALTRLVSKRKGQILGALEEVEGAGQLTLKTAASMTGVVALLAVDLALHGLRIRAANLVEYLLDTPKDAAPSRKLPGGGVPAWPYGFETRATPDDATPSRKVPGGGPPAVTPHGLETRKPECLEVGEPPLGVVQKFWDHPPHIGVNWHHKQPVYGMANKGIDLDKGSNTF